MSSELTEDTLLFSKIIKWNHSLTIKVKDFSDETIHKSGKPADIVESNIEVQVLDMFSLDLFANGMTSDEQGYVTVTFRICEPDLKMLYDKFELSCVFRVIDASENKRFPQSYLINSQSYWSSEDNRFFPIIVDRLLKRDFLLSDKDNLLPGDCLCLHIECELRRMVDYEPFVEVDMEDSFVINFKMNYCLQLDSELAERLAEFSTYFSRLLETPMIECKTRYMELAVGECTSLMEIYRIIMGVKEMTFDSISNICQMYITADKYDIPIAVESCRDLLTALLRVENDPATAELVKEKIPSLLELAETYDDVQLKGNIESFLNNCEDDEYNGCAQEILQSNLETEWKFERGFSGFGRFLFKRNTSPRKEKPWANVYN